MSERITGVVTTDEALPSGVVRLAPARVALTDGDVVRVQSVAGRSTVGRLDLSETLDADAVHLSADLSKTLDADDGAVVVVEPTAVAPARELVVAPVAQLSIRGGENAVREALADRPVTAGDTVTVSLLNGTFDVPLRVTDTTPGGAVTLDPSTELELVSGPAPAPTDRRATTPVPPAAVGGYEETVATCRAAIAEPLRRPDAYRVDGSSAAAGVLVHGQAGVGKTWLVRHAAWLADAALVHVDGARLESAARVDDTFAEVVGEVTTRAPALVHVDGMDALAAEEAGTRAEPVAAWLERLAARDDVVVVGEARDPDDLPAALVRGGRLSRFVSVPPPTAADRAELLAVLTRGLDVAPSVDLSTVADRTLGYVAADLVALRARWIEAALTRTDGADDGPPTLTTTDVETALAETAPSAVSSVGSIPSTTFDDIGGLDDVKRELVRAVEWPLTHPEALARLGVDTPAGVLLYGPPGTGKTMLARAVASTTDANFLTVNGPELLNKYVGESERRVRQLFDRARDSAPSVVFFDEIDALGGARGDDGDSSAPERVVSQLLTELDGLTAREQVTVIGATNRPDRIDDALTRPGRFDRVVEVPLPDPAARREILRIHIRDRPFESLDIEALVRETEGYSGSDIAAMLQEACLLALEERLAADADGVDAASGPDAAEPVDDDLVVRRRHVVRALDRTGPSLSAAQRERYAAFGDDGAHPADG
jgi:transitional endoplasmic reticulum ATPase